MLASVSLSLKPCDAATRYDKVIKSASDRYFGLSSDWQWHKGRIRVESNFDTAATSWVGAVGLAQFMPATAETYGDSTGLSRYDPIWSINSMVRYAANIWTFLGKSTIEKMTVQDHQMLSDAGYNWGEGRVAKLCKKTGFTWESASPKMPKETREYSPRIQEWSQKYKSGLAR